MGYLIHLENRWNKLGYLSPVWFIGLSVWANENPRIVNNWASNHNVILFCTPFRWKAWFSFSNSHTTPQHHISVVFSVWPFRCDLSVFWCLTWPFTSCANSFGVSFCLWRTVYSEWLFSLWANKFIVVTTQFSSHQRESVRVLAEMYIVHMSITKDDISPKDTAAETFKIIDRFEWIHCLQRIAFNVKTNSIVPLHSKNQ